MRTLISELYCIIPLYFLVLQNDVFDSNIIPSPVLNKIVAKPSVRRTVSDSIGARLRKISFEIGNGRRHSDEFTTDELKNVPQVCGLFCQSTNQSISQSFSQLVGRMVSWFFGRPVSQPTNQPTIELMIIMAGSRHPAYEAFLAYFNF